MWVWILTVLYVIQAIVYFIVAITLSVNIDEVKRVDMIESMVASIQAILCDDHKKNGVWKNCTSQVAPGRKDRAIGVLVFFWVITVLDMIASISVIGALV